MTWVCGAVPFNHYVSIRERQVRWVCFRRERPSTLDLVREGGRLRQLILRSPVHIKNKKALKNREVINVRILSRRAFLSGLYCLWLDKINLCIPQLTGRRCAKGKAGVCSFLEGFNRRGQLKKKLYVPRWQTPAFFICLITKAAQSLTR